MPREVKHREHGRARYQNGCKCPTCMAAGVTVPCRCQKCTEDNRAYARRNKRLKVLNGGVPVEHVPPPPGVRVERDPRKLVEARVQQALDMLGPVAEEHPDLAAGALAMGRLLDDPTSTPQHPSAVGQMRALMKDLRVAKAAADRPSGAGGERPQKATLSSLRGGRAGGA